MKIESGRLHDGDGKGARNSSGEREGVGILRMTGVLIKVEALNDWLLYRWRVRVMSWDWEGCRRRVGREKGREVKCFSDPEEKN